MRVQIANEFIVATFDTLGAELISLKSNDKEYIWEGNPSFWDKQSHILFPTIGSLKDDTYFLKGKAYHLPRHGFAREKQFQVIEHSADKIIFSLKDDAETFKVYPFSFEVQIAYVVVKNKMEVHYKVQNNSEDKMYFSIGGHPGFALSEDFEKYLLLFENEKQLCFSLLENHLLLDTTQILETNNKTLALNYELFEKDALVFKNHKIKSITIQESGKDFVKVSFKGFPDLCIWTKVSAPFICIEPWFGHADVVKTNQELTEKQGIINLPINELFQSVYTIEIFV
jgi:galactose mutarotase-like enzyme